jgi:hypothetical protein
MLSSNDRVAGTNLAIDHVVGHFMSGSSVGPDPDLPGDHDPDAADRILGPPERERRRESVQQDSISMR